MWGHIARLANNKIYKNHDTIAKNFSRKIKDIQHIEQPILSDSYLNTNQNNICHSLPITHNEYPSFTHSKLYGLDALQFQFKGLKLEEKQIKQQQEQKQINQSETQPKKVYFKQNSLQLSEFQANSPSQDRTVINHLTSIEALVISVFDGHGGFKMSDYAAKTLPELLDIRIKRHLQNRLNEDIQGIIQQSITWAYQQIQDKFYQILESQFKAGNKEVMKVGSCGITVLLYANKIIVANAGDSQAIIVTENSKTNSLSFIECNQRLSVNCQSEKKRIMQKFKGIDQNILVKDQHNGIYLKGLLQPTKTLGDYYLKKQKYYSKIGINQGQFKGPYLDCIPEISTFQIQENFKYLVVASDGLWDFLTKKDVLLKIKQNENKNIYNEQSQQDGFIDLSKTYVEKNHQQKKWTLSQYLKMAVLQRCAQRKNLTVKQLQNLPRGTKRNYCDDISIVTVQLFQKNELYSGILDIQS